MTMESQSQQLELYRTADLCCAAAISLFVPIAELDKSNLRRAIFVFEKTEECNKVINAFWNQELKVEPRLYFEQLKAIKSRLYEPD